MSKTIVVGPINSGAAAGSAGSAISNANSGSRICGLLQSIYVKYNDSPPATTDVVIKSLGTSPSAPSLTFLTLTNANTDGWFHPRCNIHNPSGASQASVWDKFPIDDYVNVDIAGANAADNVDVWLMIYVS